MIDRFLCILNPFIWVINVFMYFSHLDMYRDIEYESYDFTRDIKYFPRKGKKV